MPIFERLGYHSQYRHHRQQRSSRITGSAPTHDKIDSRQETQDDQETSITPSASSINIQLIEGEARLDKQEAQVVKDLGTDFTFDTMKVSSNSDWLHTESYVVRARDCLDVADMQDEQFAIFAVANVALIHITSCLNEMHLCIKQLVGERELAGFEQTQERWARMEMTTV